MSTDVLGQLRAADPCPDAVSYDTSVAQRNIDAIVRTDLVVAALPVPRRRRRVSFAAVAAAVVVLAVGGTVVGVEVLRDRGSAGSTGGGGAGGVAWTIFSGNGVTFDHPAYWTSYPVAPPSSMGAAVAYLSTVPLGPACTVTTPEAGVEQTECRAPQPDLSRGGTLVLWGTDASPSPVPLDRYPGQATVFGGLPARRDDSTVPTECEATGAVAGVRVAIATSDSSVLTMTACIGPGGVDGELAAVDRMLASVRFTG